MFSKNYKKIKKSSNYGKIQMEDVRVSFEGENKAILDNFSISIEPGEFISILGTSGVGKTTLLRAISGFKRIDKGYIRINGLLTSSSFVHVQPEKRRLGFVFQDYALFPHINVFENIGFGISKRDKSRTDKINKIIDLIALKSHESKFPVQLSGGQQQRVAIGRALAINPSAILMDEPFSNLDYKLKESLSREVKKIINQSKTTAILVTHDEVEAKRLSDKCFILENGKLKSV